jgi:WD40 repeat protein/tRNA A-37 threonylcarbamoyl transferase component Bud32
MPTSPGSRDYGRFDELAEEFAERCRQGERPSLEEYANRCPDLADEIREMFAALAEVEQVEEDARDEAIQRKQPALPLLKVLGDYRIVREIGHGGMGVVYEAEQVSLGRRVALKVLPRHVASDRKVLERFRREAKAAARLHHTNIVPVFEIGQEGEVAFYTMQFIQGQALDQVIDELERLRCPDRKSIATDHDHAGFAGHMRAAVTIPSAAVAAAKPRSWMPGQAAESLLRGWIGRERLESAAGAASAATEPAATEPISPHAISRARDQYVPAAPLATEMSSSAVLPGGTAVSMVGSSTRGQPFFRSVAQIGRQAAQGLAYAHSRGIVHRDIKPSNLLLDTAGVVWITDFGLAKGENDDLTATGDILGTFRYMAPERFRGEGDARADIYALGLTLYELLTLRPAFELGDRLKLIERIKTEEPARPRSLDARIPRDLETIVLKAIEKDPKQRYASMEAMAEDLRRFLDDEPIQARRTSAAERSARWARRHPAIAALGAVVITMLVLTTLASLFVADRMTRLAQNEQKSLAAAQAETYRAILSEAKALRAGHQPGWRQEALGDLARLAVMPTPRRDPPELRTEAAATLGTADIGLVAKVELPVEDLGSFTFSSDGQTLLTAGLRTGLDFWNLPGICHLSSVESLTVSDSGFDNAVYLANGQGLAVGTRDHGVVFTDTHGSCAARAPITQGSSRPTKLAISARGQRIAVAWTDGAGITVHDVASGRLLDKFKGSPFALSPDGRWLACQESSDIVLRPIASGEPRIVLGRHSGANALAFSPDGTTLATVFENTTVLWDVAKREQFGTLRGHRERIFDVAFSPDGGWIATASLDYTVRIWETRTGQTVATLPGAAPVRRVHWSPTGEYLATSTYHSSRDVFIYKITGRHRVQQWLTGHRVELARAAAHPRLERITTSGYSELISWDLSAPRPTPLAMEPNPGAVTSMAYSPDGSLLATASWPMYGSGPREISIRDGKTGKVQGRISRPDIVYGMAFDPAGERLACGDNAGNVVVYDVATSRPVQQFVTGSTNWSIDFLDRPRSLVTHGKDSVLLFNLDSGELQRKVDLAGGGIRIFVVDRARSRLVVGFQNGAIGSLSLPGLAPGRWLENAHNGSVECLALSPDGRLLATGGADRHVVLRDAVSFEMMLRLPVWAGNLRDLTFDSRGRRLAIVGTDFGVDLWDLAALHDGLTAVGLAWDRPAPAVVPASSPVSENERLSPAVSVIRRPGTTDPAAPKRTPQ